MTSQASRTIRVVTIDHSPVGRERLKQICAGCADIRVVGEATNEAKALSTVTHLRPDVVVVDCELPKGTGYAVVHEIMATTALPMIMVAWNPAPEMAAHEARALDAGAVAFLDLSPRLGRDAGSGVEQVLVRTIRAMSEIKVVHRRRGRLTESLGAARADGQKRTRPTEGDARCEDDPPPPRQLEIVAVGASTGGPPAFQTILRRLPRPFPVPILLAQHMTPGFQVNFIEWLGDSTGVCVRLAEHGTDLRPGVVYVAPDTEHMGVDRSRRVLLSPDPPENGSRPSVSFLFRSVAEAYGSAAVGVLLTGMGRDGARELRQLRDIGAVTIAQDEESSVVHGMPGEAIKLKGARYIVPPEKIADVLGHLFVGPRAAGGSASRAAIGGRGS